MSADAFLNSPGDLEVISLQSLVFESPQTYVKELL